MKWISRTILLLMLSSGAALLAFGPRPNEKVPPGRVVVSYWEKWTGSDMEAMLAIVDDFNKTVGAEKGIYVRNISLANLPGVSKHGVIDDPREILVAVPAEDGVDR